MREKKSPPAPMLNIGTSSFLVVFLVLCLVTFAILSVSTSKSDYTLAEKGASRKTEYQSAVNRSEEKLKELDDRLAEAYRNSRSFSEYLSLLGAVLGGSEFEMSSEDGRTVLVSFTEEMTDRQQLFVSVTLTDPWTENTDVFYRMSGRKVTDTVQWEGDETITLMDF